MSHNTLHDPAVSRLLDGLFADAQRSQGRAAELFGHLSPAERAAHLATPGFDHRAFYGMMKDIHLPVSKRTGQLLYLLARGSGARNVVEFGTSFGISTVHLAAAVRDNGGGRVIGTEFEPSKLAHARSNLTKAGLSELVELREGDALQTLARDLPDAIDLVLLDGHKPLYAQILALLESKLRAGAYIIADNADACPDYVARVRAADSGYLSLAFDEDVELSLKV